MKVILGANVRRYREKIGFTQLELAELIDQTETSIGLLERGKVWPEYARLEKIAGHLRVQIEALFELPSAIRIEPTPAEALEVLQNALRAPRLIHSQDSPLVGELITAAGGLQEDELRTVIDIVRNTAALAAKSRNNEDKARK